MTSIDFSNLKRIDVHAHAITPKYRQFLIQTGHANPDGMPGIPEWTPEQHISLMEETNITFSILSISTPGTCLEPFNPSLTREITRTTNIELSEICKAHPEHFRFFASLPLPSVGDSLDEIDYALDTLGAIGFCVLSNANGVYLGDPALDPILDKLNERKAVLFIHPTSCKIISPTHSHGTSASSDTKTKAQMTIINPLPIPSGLLEYMFDETRSVINLLLSSTISRCPDIKFIMSHAGCVLPSLLERVAIAMQTFFNSNDVDSEKMKDLLRERFHFDLAGVPWPDMIHGVLRVVGPERLLFGSDYCWTPLALVKQLIGRMDEGAGELWSEDEIREVYEGNARKLLGL